MWVIRAAIEPMVWAFTCDKSKTGNCLPSGFTHSEKDAKKYKTYEGAVRAEMKLRKENGYTHNQTEASATQESTTMTTRTTEELQDVLNNSDVADIVKQICDSLENAESCETLADFESNMRELLTLAKSLATEIKTVRS
jgi:hypothetical protein